MDFSYFLVCLVYFILLLLSIIWYEYGAGSINVRPQTPILYVPFTINTHELKTFEHELSNSYSRL